MNVLNYPFTATSGLPAPQLSCLQDLVQEVRETDRLELKLNWDLTTASGTCEVNNFCCWEGDRLIGYAQLDADGEFPEMTAAVAPVFRQRDIFRRLLDSVQREVRRRKRERLLLVNYRASASGAAAVQALGLPYLFSEYRMEADSRTVGELPTGTINLVRVGETQIPDLARLQTLTFGSTWRSPEVLVEELKQPGIGYFLAEQEDVYIGQIGIIDDGAEIYLRAFGIVLEYRRQGYGCQLLAATLRAMLAEGHTRFSLDVATDNAQALSLYESCGFRTTNIYDYHEVPLTGV